MSHDDENSLTDSFESDGSFEVENLLAGIKSNNEKSREELIQIITQIAEKYQNEKKKNVILEGRFKETQSEINKLKAALFTQSQKPQNSASVINQKIRATQDINNLPPVINLEINAITTAKRQEENQHLTKELNEMLKKQESLTAELNVTKLQLESAFKRIIELTETTKKLSEENVGLASKIKGLDLEQKLIQKDKMLIEFQELHKKEVIDLKIACEEKNNEIANLIQDGKKKFEIAKISCKMKPFINAKRLGGVLPVSTNIYIYEDFDKRELVILESNFEKKTIPIENILVMEAVANTKDIFLIKFYYKGSPLEEKYSVEERNIVLRCFSHYLMHSVKSQNLITKQGTRQKLQMKLTTQN